MSILGLRVRAEQGRGELLIRFFSGWSEFAYVLLGIRGLQAEIEFPSDWHERRAAWVRVSLGFIRVAFSFPWKWTVPDEYQCSGPTYGFTFFGDGLHLHWGKCVGRRSDPMTIVAMPWQWRHRKHEVLTKPETHPYAYLLRSGEVQRRTATIKVEQRTWTRPWLPYKRVSRAIDVEFDAEVGERSGSWKGGCVGCSYEMRPHETPVAALRRMQDERRFS